MFEGTCTHEVYVLKVEVIFFFVLFFLMYRSDIPLQKENVLCVLNLATRKEFISQCFPVSFPPSFLPFNSIFCCFLFSNFMAF